MKQDKKLGNYKFNEQNILGDGAYGKVYLGIDLRTSQKVAIKVISKELIDKDYYLQSSLNNEVEIMKKFNNRNIVKFLDAKESTRNYYIVQEFCQEGDLKKYLSSQLNGLKEEESLNILINILQGFLVLIKNGIIHRDLKPANILKNGEVRILDKANIKNYKIGDFGFAKQLSSYSLNQMLSSSVGTPIYMCPQILSQQKYTNKCDIWSIGIIYYESLYKSYPWVGINRQALLDNILSQKLVFPSNPNVSNLSKDFIEKCLQIQEKKRINWNELYEHPLVQKYFVILVLL